MKNLIKLLTGQQMTIKKQRKGLIAKVQSPNAADLDWKLLSLLPKAKKNYVFESIPSLKTYLLKRLDLQTIAKINEEITQLNVVSNLQPLNEITITVEWKKSAMWGYNPTAETYVFGLGHLTSGSIGGYGYDKQSTAVAKVLNQIPQLLQLLYTLKNKKYKTTNHELFGYGSGYGILPQFEGGVGVECYDKICNAIGYKFSTIANGSTFRVFSIKKMETNTRKPKSI